LAQAADPQWKHQGYMSGSPDHAHYARLEPQVTPLALSSPTGPLGVDNLELESQFKRTSVTTVPRNECLDFVGDSWFKTLTGVVIALNVVVFGLEIDNQELELLWTCTESCFLAFYITELTLRLLHKGPVDFFCHCSDYLWNWLDAALVVLGAVELWVLRAASEQASQTAVPKICRFFRLFRLLRLLRFFKIFQQLMTVVKAFKEMLQSFTVTFMVMAMFILINAIFCTHLLGKEEAFSRSHLREDSDHYEQEISELFHDIPTSVFTLFRVTTTDNWIEIANPVLVLDPRWGLFFILFILIAAWTMISVLTAVASDSMVAAASFRQEAEAREEEVKKKEFRDFLRKTFHEADDDESGTLDAEEFKNLIQKESLSRYMRNLGINIQMKDLEKAWEMLDVDQSGELTIDEFVMGLAYLQEGLRTKHVMNIDSEIKRVGMRTEGRLDKLSEDVSELLQQNIDLRESLKAQASNQLRHCKLLCEWLEEAQTATPEDFPKEVMDVVAPFIKPLVLRANFDAFKLPDELRADLGTSRAVSSYGVSSQSPGDGVNSATASQMTHMRSIPWMAIHPG